MINPTPNLTDTIRDKHMRVLEAIAAAAHRAGRSDESVRLVVVTKTQPVQVVEAAIDAGVRILGENYAEEAAAKIQALQSRLAPGSPSGVAAGFRVEWHMIGHIQGRKAKLVAPHFDLIHSLDSVKLAERLDRLAADLKREIPVLLEFNVGEETAKHGWPASDESGWPQLVDEISSVTSLPRIKVRGLMTMPPLSANPEDARTYFRRLRKLQEFLSARVPRAEWRELSMGTSADYGVAVEEGATLVRVGEAVLGPRPAREHT